MPHLFESDVLQGWKGVHGNGVDGMLRHPWPNAYQRPKVHDWYIHHPLHRQLLNAVQDGFTLGPVAFYRLLLE